MNPNPLLDPLLCETVEAHQRALLETARVSWVSASDWKCTGPGWLRLSRGTPDGERDHRSLRSQRIVNIKAARSKSSLTLFL